MSLATLPTWADLLIAALMVTGAGFALVGSYGLAKLSDFAKRLHGPTKASTLGVGGVLLASILYFMLAGGAPPGHELLITLFVFLTAPISAHLLMHAAVRRDRRLEPPPRPDREAR